MLSDHCSSLIRGQSTQVFLLDMQIGQLCVLFVSHHIGVAARLHFDRETFNNHETSIQTCFSQKNLSNRCRMYSHILLFNDIFSDSNATNKKCDIYRTNSYEITSNLHLIDGSILPFSVMFTCSIYLLIFISKSRKRASMTGKQLLKRRDIQFTIQTLILDVFFIVLNAPLYFVRVIETNEPSLVFQLLFFSRFTLNFFIYLAFNSLYSEENSSAYSQTIM